MTIGEIIIKYRNEHELSQREFAKRCELSNGTISIIESGINPRTHEPLVPTLSTINQLAKGMNMSIQNLMESADNVPISLYSDFIADESDNPVPIKSNLSHVISSDSIYQIPVFESVSAGFGAYAVDEIVDYIPVVIKNPYDVKETIAIKVSGDSMYPKIEDGDIIVVRRQTSVDSGSIAVVLLDGEDGLVKKVIYGPTWIELHSINSEKYPSRRFNGAEVQRLRVVGLVVGSYKTF